MIAKSWSLVQLSGEFGESSIEERRKPARNGGTVQRSIWRIVTAGVLAVSIIPAASVGAASAPGSLLLVPDLTSWNVGRSGGSVQATFNLSAPLPGPPNPFAGMPQGYVAFFQTANTSGTSNLLHCSAPASRPTVFQPGVPALTGLWWFIGATFDPVDSWGGRPFWGFFEPGLGYRLFDLNSEPAMSGRFSYTLSSNRRTLTVNVTTTTFVSSPTCLGGQDGYQMFRDFPVADSMTAGQAASYVQARQGAFVNA